MQELAVGDPGPARRHQPLLAARILFSRVAVRRDVLWGVMILGTVCSSSTHEANRNIYIELPEMDSVSQGGANTGRLRKA